MRTLFSNVTAVTMDDAGTVLEHAYVAVADKTIESVGIVRPTGAFDREYGGAGKVLMPGLIDAHTHVPMTLLRGYADGCDLQTWLNDHIFPAEARLDSRAVRAGTALALAELIASGVTCFADMYAFCDDIVEETLKAGLSANIARGVTCFDEAGFSFDTHPACREQQALYHRWHNAEDGQIRIDTCVHGEYTSFPAVWRAVSDFAKENGLGMHVHLSETRSEHEACVARWGKTPAEAFDQYGVWDVPAIAAHCVWLTGEDMALLARRGVTAVHNPVSNLKLGSGVADVPGILKAGINVALGTDGVSSNNSHDMFEEIKLAAILHKGVSLDPMAVPAAQALRMATARGAKALGRNTGMLETGRDADLILVDFDRPNLTPCHDAVSNLVYSARGCDVALTMARGKILYENGEYKTIDLEKVLREVRDYAAPLVAGRRNRRM